MIEELNKSEDVSLINQTNIAQIAIFSLQYGLFELWKSWGIEPDIVIGHSVGEVAAALCSGVLTLHDSISVIYHRSRLQHLTAGCGRMMAVNLSETEAKVLLSNVCLLFFFLLIFNNYTK